MQGGLLATLSRVFGHLNVLRVGAVVFSLSLFVVALGETLLLDACDDLLCFLGIHCLSSLLNAIASEIVQPNHRQNDGIDLFRIVGRIIGPLFAWLLSSQGFDTVVRQADGAILVFWSCTPQKVQRLELS